MNWISPLEDALDLGHWAWEVRVTEREIVLLGPTWDELFIPIFIALARAQTVLSYYDESTRCMVIKGDGSLSLRGVVTT